MVTQLEEERSSKAKKEGIPQVELPSLSTDASVINFSDQMELKQMVDAIAAASQREAEAHETAIVLSRENDELRMKLKVLIEDNNKLIELYERATVECNNKSTADLQSQDHTEITNNGSIELGKGKEAEMNKVVESLEHQLMEMHEENDKLMGLYERAMQERDELKRMLSSVGEQSVETKREFDCAEKVVEVDGERKTSESPESLEARVNTNDALVAGDIDMCTKETDDSKLTVHDRAGSGNMVNCETPSTLEKELLNCITSKVSEDINLVRMKLESADKQLLDSAQAVTMFSSLEKLVIEVGKLSREIEVMEDAIRAKQKIFESLKLGSLEMQERRALIQKKLTALKYSLSSFSSSVAYFEQREARATLRVKASTVYLDQKKKELAHLSAKKDEIQASLSKVQRSEVELNNNLACLKLKLEEENRKHENEKVLFAIDNIEKVDVSQKNWQLGGKATELLKSEEEKTKLQTEVKLSRDRLGVIRRELDDLNKKSMKVDEAMQAAEVEIQKGSGSVEEMELALEGILQEKKTLLEMRENGNAEIENMILEYQQHLFEADLKEAEMKMLEEELLVEAKRIQELQKAKTMAAEKTTQLLDTSCNWGFVAEKIEEELQSVRTIVVEAKLLLGEGSSNR